MHDRHLKWNLRTQFPAIDVHTGISFVFLHFGVFFLLVPVYEGKCCSHILMPSLFHSMWSSVSAFAENFRNSFLGLNNISVCMCILHFVYLVSNNELIPYFGHCQQCCSKHGSAPVSLIQCVHVSWVYIQ